MRVRGSVGAAYAGVAAEHGVELDADDTEARFRAAFERMPPLCFPAGLEAELPELERDWWKRLVREVLSHVDFADFGAYFDQLFDYFTDAQSWELYPDVRTALEGIESRGARMAVVSNFDARLTRICEGLGIAAFFDAVVISSRCGHAKPDPSIFQIALKQIGVPPGEALHVGDSEAEDIRGAEAAGLRALLVIRRGTATPPGQIDDLRRIVDEVG
jgi:putative hydrolase of the HAD superfamily